MDFKIPHRSNRFDGTCDLFWKGRCSNMNCKYVHDTQISYDIHQKKVIFIESSLLNKHLTKLFFVDGDNCAGSIQKLLSNTTSHILVFHAPRFSHREYDGVSTISVLTNKSDAADHALSMEASRLDMILPKHIEFCIVTSDWFGVEVCQRIIMMGRKCKLLDGNVNYESTVEISDPMPKSTIQHVTEEYKSSNRDINKLLTNVKEFLQNYNKPLPLSLLGQRFPLPEETKNIINWKSIISESNVQTYLDVSFKDDGPGKQWLIRN